VNALTPLPTAVARRRTERLFRGVRDHNGQALTYVYFEDEPGRRSAAKLHPKKARMAFLTMLCQCRHADTGALPNNPILKFPVGCTIQNVRKVSARNGHK
jgi:hypothetical protein